MNDLTPIERLQPCLLDRLTDDEPEKQEESRTQRVVSLQRYRNGVKRDLEWLFNSYSYFYVKGMESFNIRDYREAFRSVINFGTRQLCGVSSPDLQRLREDLAEALRIFEPRISARSLVIHADIHCNVVTFEVEGDLWAKPLAEHLHLKTSVDIEGGPCVVADG
jgi:type VI secretion system protein ImpF